MESDSVSWTRIESIAKILSEKITNTGKEFNSISTISRGGLVPARLMADRLDIHEILVDKNTRKLLGAHVIGPEASDMVHMLVAYMTMQATVDDLLRMIYIHPALPEILRNAALKVKMQLDGNLVVRPENKL